jgi:CHAT domain-containing protein
LKTRERQRPAPDRSLLAFADPALASAQNVTPALTAYRERGLPLTRLPSARLEVAGIRSLFQPAASQVYVGEQAQEQTVKTEKLESFRYVHFAAHGYFDDEEPSRSGIVLSQQGDPGNDGILQAAEIMRLRLNADLVTLSACQSGLGKILAGEGVMGLSRAFFYAGSQSLVVSLWNVNDAATAELMKSFYANLKSGMGRDQALRKAKLSLMSSRNRSWRNPYFWAPFIFMGLAAPGQ